MNVTTLNALIEALTEGYAINKVLVAENKKDRKVARIIALCRENRVAYRLVPAQTLDRKAGPNHQGVFAEISPVRFYDLEEILEDLHSGLLLMLDKITDSGNLGAIIRSAVAAGVDAVIVSSRDSAPVDETTLKTSAGALVKARIVQSQNLNRDIERLKKGGFWIVAADQNADLPYYGYDFGYKTVLVLGSEQKGISTLVKKNADQLVTIPHSNRVESLNVSAAAAVLLFEARRQKETAGTKPRS